MRAHNSEHRDSLPVLDVTALRHVAFVLDAIIFYMRSSNETDCDRNESGWDDQDDNETDDVDEEFSSSIVVETESIDENDMIRPSLGKRHSFFQRSESTLCLGCQAPDPFQTPMVEALPLAEQPQLLQPNARREELFGMPKQAITVPAVTEQNTSSTLELPPIKLGLSAQSKDLLQSNAPNNTVVISVTPSTSEVQPEISEEIKRREILKRPRSPQPGSSKIFVENYEDDDDSGDDEPQDLSQQALNAKMDIDDTSSSSQRMEKHLYEDSDDSDTDLLKSPSAKRHRPSNPDEISQTNIDGFSIVPSSSHTSLKNQEELDASIRPPIIVVTRRTVADAIDAATANVLSKNKKQRLSECATPETPINFLPSNFVYEGKGEHGEGSSGSKSSVIVRVGQSSVSEFKLIC